MESLNFITSWHGELCKSLSGHWLCWTFAYLKVVIQVSYQEPHESYPPFLLHVTGRSELCALCSVLINQMRWRCRNMLVVMAYENALGLHLERSSLGTEFLLL